MYPNSVVAQIMISSANLERLMPIRLMTKVNSETTSLAEVPSMEFCVVAAKPNSLATKFGSSPKLEPASAPAP